MESIHHLPTSPPSQEPTAPAAPSSATARERSWVPVRSLTSRHRDRLREHLLALDERDRYLRFGFSATDAQIVHYTDTLDFDRDEVFGIFNRRLDLIAMAHLAYAPAPQIKGQAAMAEFGVSVSKHARGRGLGARLFDHAILHARNRHISKLFIYALSENSAMLKIARNAGATVERSGSESEAWLALPPDDIASQVGEIVESQAAEWDYQMKLQAKQINDVIGTLFPTE
ncbi:MAG TPA: GNAT family N-acetyltransferase [Burkholderiaceae bacterium]|nr:GNAT family N-acetyltransferase [Burkholderiaceae bacterium]